MDYGNKSNSSIGLPDNLKSRIARAYFKKSSFTPEGEKQPIEYEKFCVEVLIKGEVFTIDFKPKKNDKAILMLADNLDTDGLGV